MSEDIAKLPDATVEVRIGVPERYSAAMITAEFPRRQCLADSAPFMGLVSVQTINDFVTCVAE